MLDIDHLYDKVAKGNPTRDELLEIIDTVDSTNSFGNSTFSVDDLFLKIAQSDKATDDMIKFMYDIQVENYWGSENHTSRMLDYGSKTLFDKLWGTENKYGKWIKLFRCKHTDADQLQTFYNEVIKANKKGVSKKWLEENKQMVLSHPNCPEKIQNTNLKNRESMEAIAKIPRPSKKALEAINQWVYYPGKLPNDQIFINFLEYSALPWLEVAKIAELKAHLESEYGKTGLQVVSKQRLLAIFKFCKRPDTPEQVREFLYKHTEDEDFLPQVAKDVFLF